MKSLIVCVAGILFFSQQSVAKNKDRWAGLLPVETITLGQPSPRPTVQEVEQLILRLSSKVSKGRAHSLADSLVRWSPLPLLSAAIFMQESGFQDTHVMVVGLDREGHHLTTVYKDMGIAQINAATALEFKCNVDKLIQHNLEEAVRCHSKVLAAKLVLCNHLGEEAASCYNSMNEKPRKEYWSRIKYLMNKGKIK